jgi:HipA-like C-terminal domain
MFEVISVPAESRESLEPLGTKPKFWFKGAFKGIELADCLFKETRPNTGEDWAEKIASELCGLLGLPHIDYELAVWQDRRGVVCCNFVPEGYQLVHGNELLAKMVSGYPSTQFYHERQYTLRRVLAIFRRRSEQIKVPMDWDTFAGVTSAIDVFVGYLMFDAWIANQDRHHQNWGLIVTPESTRHLAPSYDHASSLGRIETDKERQERLTTRDQRRSMTSYVARARSAFFASSASNKPLSTLDAFREAGKIRPVAARSWLKRLAEVSSQEVQGFFAQVPHDRITPVAIEFALKILELNRQRLLMLEEEFL